MGIVVPAVFPVDGDRNPDSGRRGRSSARCETGAGAEASAFSGRRVGTVTGPGVDLVAALAGFASGRDGAAPGAGAVESTFGGSLLAVFSVGVGVAGCAGPVGAG